MLILADYAYQCPGTVQEAVQLLQQEGSVLMAGGSDLMPQLKFQTAEPKLMIDLSRIPELKVLEQRPDGFHIGSMVTLTALAESPLVQNGLPALAQAAANVGSPQIRNRGTIGGNVLQARRCFYYNQTKEWRQGIPRCYKVGGDRCIQIPHAPACRALYDSDLAPVLLACQAAASVLTAEGEKTISCRELIEAHTADTLEKLLIREFIIPPLSGWSKFMKYSLRNSIDFPVINFAIAAEAGNVRFFAGAVAPCVVELTDTAKYLVQQGSDFDADEAANLAVEELTRKSQLIREAGLSIQTKRGAFRLVDEILNAFKTAAAV